MYPELAFRKLGRKLLTLEGGGKGDAPAAPDYTGAAKQQGDSSKEVTAMQNYANRPTQITPWGSVDWTTGRAIDPGTGKAVTSWQQNLNLTPDSQAALDAQLQMARGRSELANSTMGRVQSDVANPWDYSGFTQRRGGNMPQTQLNTGAPQQLTYGSDPQAFAAERQRIEQGLFDRMRPEHQFQTEAIRTRLSNQGLTEGSPAYNRAMQRLEDQQARERFNALEMGGNEQARQQAMLLAQNQQAFGQDVASQQYGNSALMNQQSTDITGANFINNLRQQEIAEEAQRRGMSLNEMNALITGQQVSMPQMPGFISAGRADPTQFLTAAQMTENSALDRYNAQQAGQQSAMSGLFRLGGTIAGGMFGGPFGAMVGSQVGGAAGSLFG